MSQQILFIITMVLLVSASYQDIRAREVPDPHGWVLFLLSAVGMVFYDPVTAMMSSAGVISLGLAVFCDLGNGGLPLSVLAVVLLVSASAWSGEMSLAVSAALVVFLLLMYAVGTMSGGADIKILLGLALVFPMYPDFGSMIWMHAPPMELIVNPVVSTLFIALLASFVWLLPVAARQGRLTATYPLRIGEARGSFVFPVSDTGVIRDEGMIERYYSDMEREGVSSVNVTPMIPFIPFVTAAFLFTILLGNPIFPIRV